MEFQELTSFLNDSFLLRHQSELQDYWLTCRDKVAKAQAQFLTNSLTELSHLLLYGKRVKVEQIETGYDCSDWPSQSSEGFCPENYATLAELMQEATGERRPTWVSGYGMAAQTWEEALQERWEVTLTEIFYGERPEAWEEEEGYAGFEDAILSWQNNLSAAMLEDLQGISVQQMLHDYREQAQALEQAHEAQDILQQRLNMLRIQTARAVHKKVRALLPREKYEASEAELLQAGLQRVKAQVDEIDFQVYLHSPIFASLCSNALRDTMRSYFSAQGQS